MFLLWAQRVVGAGRYGWRRSFCGHTREVRYQGAPRSLWSKRVTPCNNDPWVSDDNEVTESLIQTLKVRPRFPSGGFKCIDTCRDWTQESVWFYSFQHRQKGLSWGTPSQRHVSQHVKILDHRSRVYAAARQVSPNRCSREERKWIHIKSVPLNGGKVAIIKKIAA